MRTYIQKRPFTLALTIGAALAGSLLNATTYNCSTFPTDAINPYNPPHFGITNDGTVVGSDAGGRGFIRDRAGNVTLVDYPGQSPTRLFTINNHGMILGGWGNGQLGASQGYFILDSAGNFSTITIPSPYNGIPLLYGINDNGVLSGRDLLSGAFFELKQDGTALLVAGAEGSVPGSINNSLLMLETGPGVSSEYPMAALVGPGITPTIISGNDPSGSAPTAFGLNNAGTVAGYIAHYLKAAPFGGPWTGFVREASGTYWSLVCNGLTSIQPSGINDSGVITGVFVDSTTLFGGFIATPLPGSAQYTGSISSIDFGTVPYGQTTSPVTFTIANAGNVRMDIGGVRLRGHQPPFGSPDFTVTACITQGLPAISLQPGESCLVTVALLPGRPAGVNLGDIVLIDDSAPGSPHLVVLSASMGLPPAPPPSCTVSGLSAGPPRQVTFTMQDAITGLQSITALDAVNVNAPVPAFETGATGAVIVTASQIDQNQTSKIDLQVTNTAGLTATCSGAIPGAPSQWTGENLTFKGKPFVGAVHDGSRLEAFVRGSDNTVLHSAQTSPGVWSAWESLGGQTIADPTAILTGSLGAQVFVVGTHGSLWTRERDEANSTWSDWKSLGGMIAGKPVAIEIPDGVEVFARGVDSALWAITQNSADGSWSEWRSLGGVMQGDPAPAINGNGANGEVNAFVRGAHNGLWLHVEDNSGSFWRNLGGYFGGNPVVLSNDFTLQVFLTGTDNALWHIVQSPNDTQVWSAWEILGGYLTSDPAVVTNNDGKAETFVLGGDHALWHKVETAPGGPWSDTWTSLGSPSNPEDGTREDFTGAVSAALPRGDSDLGFSGNGRVEVLAGSPDGKLWDIAQTAPGLWQ
jgi:hypothetical protein